ncbi:MAG: nitroreductase family protein [Faecalicoccus sp.]|nr:nitroreductase family protein [Faecalicoccus sp.]
MKTFKDIVQTRRSTRQFSGEKISDETIQNILDIAAYAPSSWGGHPMEYIVIRDKDTLKKLAACKRMGAGPLAYGDAAIVPIIRKDNLELWVEDASVASTFILLAAEYYGVGACWIHMKDRKGHTGMAEDDIRDLLHIPSNYGILNVVSLGMKKKEDSARDIKPVVHMEKY